MATYICPHCKNPINDDEALLCLFCGESLNRGNAGRRGWKIAFIALVILLALSFFLSLIF